MLVLSRRSNEKIVFPEVGVTVHLLSTKGGVARIGIEAPPAVPILRGELAPKAPASAGPSAEHRLRNRLSKMNLSLHVLQRQLEAGLQAEAQATLDNVLAQLETLDRDLAAARGRPKPATLRCRALVVDDDSNERELLAGLLGMHGCECPTAADGQDCLDYLASHERPDFVLLDMWMPRCDGPDALRQIRADPRFAGLKVFGISGTSPEDLGVGTGPSGVDAWFSKPLDPRKLWEAMQQALGARN
jgi:carbon storage regulator CsrA